MAFRVTKNIGLLLLAIFLILWGLQSFVALGGFTMVLAVLAIVAGVFILIGR